MLVPASTTVLCTTCFLLGAGGGGAAAAYAASNVGATPERAVLSRGHRGVSDTMARVLKERKGKLRPLNARCLPRVLLVLWRCGLLNAVVAV